MTTLAHLSDVHIGKDDSGVVGPLVQDVAAHAPDATIVTGDLTMRARTAEFAAARQFLAQLPQPRLVVLGNHDVPLWALHRRFADPYRKYVEGLRDDAKGLDPVLAVQQCRILGLQSMPRWRWKSGRVSRRQAGLVVDTLGPAPAADLRVLALHHPPSLTGLARSAGSAGLNRAMAVAEVDLVLAGHTHVPSVSQREVTDDASGRSAWVVEVVCGTSASTRTRGVPPSWMLIRTERRSVNVEVRQFSRGRWRAAIESSFDRQPR